MSSPLVTVVSPLYNAERFVRGCMESVMQQTYSNWRYVVIDNACKDATGDIARELAATDDRVTVVRNPETVPVIENHNVAFSQATDDTTYLRVLQGDDRLRPDCLERAVAVGEAHPSVGIIGSYLQWGDRRTSDEFDPARSCFPGAEVARRTLLGETYPFLSPSGVMFRWAAICDRQPVYDERYLHADVLLCMELLRTWDFGLVHDVLTDVGSDDASVTATDTKPLNKTLASNLQILQTHAPDFLDDAAYRERLEERLEHYYTFLGFALLEGRDDAFWTFHREALAAAGVPLSRSRLWRRCLMNLVEDPRPSVRRLRRRLLSPSIA